jgi:hypothetical protein
MVPIAGGTQALKRTLNVVLNIRPDIATVISVPRPFAAVILKAAAYDADSRDVTGTCTTRPSWPAWRTRSPQPRVWADLTDAASAH